MTLVLAAVGLALLLVPAVLARAARRAAPADLARAGLAAAVVGLAAVELALMLGAAPTLLRAAGVPSLAATCNRLFGRLALGGPFAGWLALAGALALPIAAAVHALRARRELDDLRMQPGAGGHGEQLDHEVVVLDHDRFLALGVGGPRPQVVLSSALVEALEPEELAAVIRHEVAHLRHHHERYLLAASTIERCLGPLGLLVGSGLRHCVERWADEEAAGPSPDERARVRDALLHVALGMAPTVAAGFGGSETVAERVRALEAPAPGRSALRRALAFAPLAGGGVAAVWVVGAWAAEARMMLTTAGYCLS